MIDGTSLDDDRPSGSLRAVRSSALIGAAALGTAAASVSRAAADA